MEAFWDTLEDPKMSVSLRTSSNFGRFWVSPKCPEKLDKTASYRDLWSSDFGISGILERISEQTSANPEIGSKSEIWS